MSFGRHLPGAGATEAWAVMARHDGVRPPLDCRGCGRAVVGGRRTPILTLYGIASEVVRLTSGWLAPGVGAAEAWAVVAGRGGVRLRLDRGGCGRTSVGRRRTPILTLHGIASEGVRVNSDRLAPEVGSAEAWVVLAGQDRVRLRLDRGGFGRALVLGQRTPILTLHGIASEVVRVTPGRLAPGVGAAEA